MATFQIAHIREQGVDMIIVIVDQHFGQRPPQEQSKIIESLQSCARAAGLAGTVVPVWREGNSHSFIAPNHWHTFLRSLSWKLIQQNINKKLTCL